MQDKQAAFNFTGAMRSPLPVQARIALILTVTFSSSLQSTAFTNVGRHINSCTFYHTPFYVCHAKPPPKSKFDLEKILELELLEQNMNSPPSEIYDDDNDEEIDMETDDWVNMLVPDKLNEMRIDSVIDILLKEYEDLEMISRSQIGDYLQEGKIYVTNGDSKHEVVKRKSFKVLAGQTISFSRESLLDRYAGLHLTEIKPEKIPLNILFEDEHMIVINKFAGMVVHPAAGNWNGTLVNALAYHLANESPFGAGEFVGQQDNPIIAEEAIDGIEGEKTVFYRPGVVHRLDKGTTGVIVVAKTTDTLAKLSEMFASRQVKKTYVTVTVGNPGNSIVIDNHIGRHPIHRQRMRVVPLDQSGKRAITFVDSMAFDGKLSFSEVKIQTGRTHQIRVHMQDRGTPVYGDDVYGISDWNKKLFKQLGIHRPLLHAHQLELDHPISGKGMVFKAPMANDMARIVDIIWPEGRMCRPELFET